MTAYTSLTMRQTLRTYDVLTDPLALLLLLAWIIATGFSLLCHRIA